MNEVEQKLVRLMLLKTVTKKRAKRKLPELLAMLEHLKDSPLRTLGHKLKSWLQRIIAMWRFSKTNGITEGFHTKM